MRILFRCDPALEGRLPRPVPAKEALPDWLSAMPRHAFSPLHGGEIRTVKHCPPFLDAMTHGFMMTLPCDIRVQARQLSWDWDVPDPAVRAHPRAPISFHVPEQVAGTPWDDAGRDGAGQGGAGQVIVKFNSFWTIELEPGWSLFAMHPANRDDLPFRLLSGLVDADRFHDVGILFPALWCDPDFDGVLPRGLPVAQCIPVRREPAELTFDVLDPEAMQRYEDTADALLSGPGVYRRHYRARRRSGPGGEGIDQGGGV